MTVFYAWELGGNLGHVARWSTLQQALTARNIETFTALRELPGGNRFTIQAPIVVSPQLPYTAANSPHSFTDILAEAGWNNFDKLSALVEKWRTLFIRADASLILLDFAPTAALAALTLGIPTLNFGNPFYAPPKISPMPSLRPWQPIQATILQAKDNVVLQVVNKVLGAYQRAPLENIYSAVQATYNGIMTIPEFDCFARDGDQNYWGFLPPPQAQTPEWPDGEGPRVFAYLPSTHPHLSILLSTLANSRLRALVFVPGLNEIPALPPHIKFCAQPQDLEQLSQQVDCAITVAPTTTAHFVLKGVPVLCAPVQLEQFLGSLQVAGKHQAGFIIRPDMPVDHATIQQGLQRLAFDKTFRTNAQKLAQKYPSPYQALERILTTITTHLGQ